MKIALSKRCCLCWRKSCSYNHCTMRRTKRPSLALLAAMLLAGLLAGQFRSVGVEADASDSSLVISQLKITSANGQFITLYNPTNTTLDMGKYQLEYFNSYDLAKATSSKLISLTGLVPPHGYFMVNDSSQLLCYQLTVDSVSLGLSSTAGLVEVLAYSQSGPGSLVTPVLEDFVGWSKNAAAGAQTLPGSANAFLQRQPVDASGNPAVPVPGSGSWQSVQPSVSNACTLIATTDSAPAPAGFTQLLPPIEPPATFTGSSTALPATYQGQMAPLITEILPNPAGTGNDGLDEFIEIYNPNITGFDLSGFSLQAGITSLHSFNVPDGTVLPAQSFTTFYADTTHLSLSNSGGQVKLIEPSGTVVGSTATYGPANDGQAWALANGKWYWTTQPTPGEPNIIAQPQTKTSSSASTAKAKQSKAKAKTVSSSKSKKTKARTKLASTPADAPAQTTPIHASTLAVIVGLALLYGAYEYRADLANGFNRLRRNLGFSRSHRP